MDTMHRTMEQRFGRKFTDKDLSVINAASELAECVAYRSIDDKFDQDTFEFRTRGYVAALQVKTLFSLRYIVRVDRCRRINVQNLLGVVSTSYDSIQVCFPLLRFSIETAPKATRINHK